jgi:hypothetical protein
MYELTILVPCPPFHLTEIHILHADDLASFLDACEQRGWTIERVKALTAQPWQVVVAGIEKAILPYDMGGRPKTVGEYRKAGYRV